MELTEENLDYMDCRPPTDRDTGIKISAYLQKMIDERKAARAAMLMRINEGEE